MGWLHKNAKYSTFSVACYIKSFVLHEKKTPLQLNMVVFKDFFSNVGSKIFLKLFR